MKKKQWTILSNHGRVIVYLAKYPKSTVHTIANDNNLSIPGVNNIIKDLVDAGYLERTKVGRCSVYEVHPELPMRHPLFAQYPIREILKALGYDSQTKKE